MVADIHPIFSSNSVEWGTPRPLFDALDAAYAFALDAAASADNALCETYFTREDDGLAQDWHPYRRVWLNPPFGRGIEKWMRKAYEESRRGCIVVCLVPARVDTRWWHDWVEGKARITFIKGRLKYIDHSDIARPAGTSPFPSALLTYTPDLVLGDPDAGALERKCLWPVAPHGARGGVGSALFR